MTETNNDVYGKDRPNPVRDGGGRRSRGLLVESVAGRRLPATRESVDVLEYGRVGHSPARYNVPGRAIIDESNTFFYGETNLDGVLDLVSRSKKPVQELAWASIGNVLTAIQICEAYDRDVLVPWNSWRHEFDKSMGTLHGADRGGFIRFSEKTPTSRNENE